MPSSCTQLDSQVGADVVTHNASSRYPCVIADLAVCGVLEKLQEETKQQGSDSTVFKSHLTWKYFC